MRSVRNLKGGLQEISDSMGVRRRICEATSRLPFADHENRTAASGRVGFPFDGAGVLPDEEELFRRLPRRRILQVSLRATLYTHQR